MYSVKLSGRAITKETEDSLIGVDRSSSSSGYDEEFVTEFCCAITKEVEE